VRRRRASCAHARNDVAPPVHGSAGGAIGVWLVAETLPPRRSWSHANPALIGIAGRTAGQCARRHGAVTASMPSGKAADRCRCGCGAQRSTRCHEFAARPRGTREPRRLTSNRPERTSDHQIHLPEVEEKRARLLETRIASPMSFRTRLLVRETAAHATTLRKRQQTPGRDSLDRR
jgi:hypothetical protein